MKTQHIRVIRTVALLLCLLLTVSTSASPHTSDIAVSDSDLNSDNHSRVMQFIESDDFYDLGLFSTMDLAVLMISPHNPAFARLCQEEDTVSSLYQAIQVEDDAFIRMLLMNWCLYLEASFGMPSQATLYNSNSDDYVDYYFTTDSGKTIRGTRYIGSAIPPQYGNIEDYPNATLIYNPSYRLPL